MITADDVLPFYAVAGNDAGTIIALATECARLMTMLHELHTAPSVATLCIKGTAERIAVDAGVQLALGTTREMRALGYELFPLIAQPKALKLGSDICGFCGKPGANTIPKAKSFPTEKTVTSRYVHANCQHQERLRALHDYANLPDEKRAEHLRSL